MGKNKTDKLRRANSDSGLTYNRPSENQDRIRARSASVDSANPEQRETGQFTVQSTSDNDNRKSKSENNAKDVQQESIKRDKKQVEPDKLRKTNSDSRLTYNRPSENQGRIRARSASVGSASNEQSPASQFIPRSTAKVPKIKQGKQVKVNTKTEYDEIMMLMVWDSYIRRPGNIQYFISEKEYLETFFKDDGAGMAPRKKAGLLIKETNELYKNRFGNSVSICGPVDYKKNKAENAITTNLEVAIEQINKWNTNKTETDNKITNHIIVFPYHITPSHWALGLLELELNESNQLTGAEVKIYNPLPEVGGAEVPITVKVAIEALLINKIKVDISSWKRLISEATKLTPEGEKYLQQQNVEDGSSCGVISAENGKAFLGNSEEEVKEILITEYDKGAEELRSRHIQEVDREDFNKAQRNNKSYQDPKFSRPENYDGLKASFGQGINHLEQKDKDKILKILRRLKNEEKGEVATKVKDFFRNHPKKEKYIGEFAGIESPIFSDFSNLFQDEWSLDERRIDNINTLGEIVEDYFREESSASKSNDKEKAKKTQKAKETEIKEKTKKIKKTEIKEKADLWNEIFGVEHANDFDTIVITANKLKEIVEGKKINLLRSQKKEINQKIDQLTQGNNRGFKFILPFMDLETGHPESIQIKVVSFSETHEEPNKVTLSILSEIPSEVVVELRSEILKEIEQAKESKSVKNKSLRISVIRNENYQGPARHLLKLLGKQGAVILADQMLLLPNAGQLSQTDFLLTLLGTVGPRILPVDWLVDGLFGLPSGLYNLYGISKNLYSGDLTVKELGKDVKKKLGNLDKGRLLINSLNVGENILSLVGTMLMLLGTDESTDEDKENYWGYQGGYIGTQGLILILMLMMVGFEVLFVRKKNKKIKRIKKS
ncbi:MAG: hypothetical protein BGO68_02550 [Candidatus Amoebophilus sp. 36-38]|nr:MAG: hypothetical protein BGO68_02550 [Candidatus Amoebophilus sp. 36-38]